MMARQAKTIAALRQFLKNYVALLWVDVGQPWHWLCPLHSNALSYLRVSPFWEVRARPDWRVGHPGSCPGRQSLGRWHHWNNRKYGADKLRFPQAK